MIFFRDALERLDCPVCLQPLAIDLDRPTPEYKTPNKCTSASSLTLTDSATSIVSFAPGVSRESEGLHYGVTGHSNASDESLTVVLPCGHFMHWLCGVQLYEYYSEEKKAACPVCRKRLTSKNDLIPFLPQTVRLPRVESSPVQKRSRDEEEEEEVMLVATGSVPPSFAYTDQLQRSTDHYAKRVDTIKGRERKLYESRKFLEEEINQLQLSTSAARERVETLFPGHLDHNNILESATRLRKLRKVCKETKFSSDQVASEMAAITRENAELQRQILKYERKLHRLESTQAKESK